MAGGSSSAPPYPGMVQWAKVSTVPSGTQFTCEAIKGWGDNFFGFWYVYVVRKSDGTMAFPFHEYDGCTAYVSSTGTFTISGLGFTDPLTAGDEIYLIHPEAMQFFLHGLVVYSGDSPQNWNSGVATSGLAGADLTTIGAATTDYVLHSLFVSIANLTVGANVTIRMYTTINGTEREIYNETYVQGIDTDGVWIAPGTLGISSYLRIEVYSDQAGDDARVIEYEYMRQA